MSIDYEDRPHFKTVYNYCDGFINKNVNIYQQLLNNNDIKRYIDFLNITDPTKNPFKDNLRIIEYYIELKRYSEMILSLN